MNLYLRYFDQEAFVDSVDQAINFLANIPEIGMDNALEADIRDYVASDVFYPKRYKVRPRIYFIIIKTEAATMQDFKEKKAVHSIGGQMNNNMNVEPRPKVELPIMVHLSEEQLGWYEGSFDFKRVLMVASGKFQYRDTHFVVRCKAHSGIDCYNRIIDHLRSRVDGRSQFPSAKGKNFQFKYLGACK